jgi:hypothetical protein
MQLLVLNNMLLICLLIDDIIDHAMHKNQFYAQRTVFEGGF